MRFFKYLLASMLILSFSLVLQPMTVGISCLKDPQSGKKRVIIYDHHVNLLPEGGGDQAKMAHAHAEQIRTLIGELIELNVPTKYHLELPHWTLRMIKEGRGPDFNTPLNVAVLWAIQNEMKLGNLEFLSFDERKDIDFWIREMALNTDQFLMALENYFPLPEDAHITLKSYLSHILERRSEVEELENELAEALVEKIKEKNNDAFAALNNYITQISEEAKIDKTNHIISLLKENTAKFLVYAINEQCSLVDTTLIRNVLADESDISVIHGGLFHAEQLSQALKTIGFIDAFAERDLKNGLKASSLFDLKIPKEVPLNFLDIIREFIAQV